MNNVILTTSLNREISKDTYEIILAGDCADNKPGQFVEIKLNGFTLRRPFCIAHSTDSTMTLVYKVVGAGTKYMSTLTYSDKLDVLTGLGNGFNTMACETSRPLLIGGGTGIASIYNLAIELKERNPIILLGFRSKEDAYYIAEFSRLGEIHIATETGELGFKGNIIEYLKTSKIDYQYYYACGPMGMLRELFKFSKNGEMSLEARMGCGFGACMGCSIKTTSGYKRVCKEGPVFLAREIVFDV
ncbi:MAG: dihydroorotate dehydrogenase electron transfer subunit [Christensenellaceae bacterium]|jgi:dihydroorotate dehydrogenase electron transfer subunit|nr:dihydroorotate dehydrogenase electron transfer subunit [Christensenellaceae bacterium]